MSVGGVCGKMMGNGTFEFMRARVFGVLLGRLQVGHVVVCYLNDVFSEL